MSRYLSQTSHGFLSSRSPNRCSSAMFLCCVSDRYHMEKEGKTCRLTIKVCRPDDECEYACGVDERRSRARLFVEGTLFFWRHSDSSGPSPHISHVTFFSRDPGGDRQTASGHVPAPGLGHRV